MLVGYRIKATNELVALAICLFPFVDLTTTNLKVAHALLDYYCR